MATDKNTIKNWFKNGLKPNQEQFWAWMDSFWHKDEQIPAEQVEGLPEILSDKVDTSMLEVKVNKDATGLSQENIVAWKNALNIGELPSNIATVDEGEKTGNVYRKTEIDELSYSKLDTPTDTSNTTAHPFVVGVDEDGNSAMLPAEELGKNISNSDMRIPNGAVRTLDVTGATFKMVGLIDADSDQTFEKQLVVKADGTLGFAHYVPKNRENVTVNVGGRRKLTLQEEDLIEKLRNQEPAQINIDTTGLEAHSFVTEEYFIRYGHYIDKPALIERVGEDNLQASYLNVDFFYTDTKQYVGTIKLNVFTDLLRHDLNASDSYLSYNVAQDQGWGFNASNWKASSILKEKGRGVTVRLRKEGVFTNYSIRSTRQINIGELYLDHQDMVFAKENIKYLFLVGERKDFVMTHLEVDDIPRLNAEGFQLKPIYVFRNEDNGSYDLSKQRIVSVGNRLSIYKENVLDNGVIYSFPTSGLRSYYRFELYDSTTNELIHQWDAEQQNPSLKSYYRWAEHPGLFKVKLWTVETRELKKQHRANAFQGIIEKLNRISPFPIEDTEETIPITGRYLQDNEEMTPIPENFDEFKAYIDNKINRYIETGESFSRFKFITSDWDIYTWILYCLDPEQFSNYKEIDPPSKEYSLQVDNETVFTVRYQFIGDPPFPDENELETEELEEEQD